MCSIAAIYRMEGAAISPMEIEETGQRMNRSMSHRGPDDSGLFADGTVCLCHNRLAVMDPQKGRQPMTIVYRNRRFTIAYNGEIYNTVELRRELAELGAEFSTSCDTEVVLWSYILWGKSCPEKLNGIFAFLIYEHDNRSLFAARDRMGVKPLYFAHRAGACYFASEPKALFASGQIAPQIDRRGLWELIFLAPVTPERSAIFRGVEQIRAGEWMFLSPDGEDRHIYWALEAKSCIDSREEAVDHLHSLLTDALNRQLVSDVPLCTFLSGGLDSSVLTALAAEAYAKRGDVLSTYSFEHEGNADHFQASLFQPAGDDLFARRLAADLATNHTVLTAPAQIGADLLPDAAIARDLPGQADVDSSLLWYCRQVKRRHTVAISGECADEIFGGYPWFYRPEMLERDFYPWLHDPFVRPRLFRTDILRPQEGYAYLSGEYRDFLSACPVWEGEADADRRARLATCLSVRYFMQNLLSRKDRMSMASGLEVRVPFADHRILEYLYNLPWAYKFHGGVEKSLLRDAAAGHLPDYILHRKKSPYPKTHNPAYEAAVRRMFAEKLSADTPFAALLDRSAVQAFLDGENVTWFGQLMARPQMIAWLVQLATWLEHYPVEICL